MKVRTAVRKRVRGPEGSQRVNRVLTGEKIHG
jgi:hypothetical protein